MEKEKTEFALEYPRYRRKLLKKTIHNKHFVKRQVENGKYSKSQELGLWAASKKLYHDSEDYSLSNLGKQLGLILYYAEDHIPAEGTRIRKGSSTHAEIKEVAKLNKRMLEEVGFEIKPDAVDRRIERLLQKEDTCINENGEKYIQEIASIYRQ